MIAPTDPPAPEPGSPIRYYTADIKVLYTEAGGFRFQLIDSDGVEVGKNGDLRLPWLEESEGVRITFRLADESDATELGDIRILPPEGQPERGPGAGDGDPYPDTFFEISRSYQDDLLVEITLVETRTGPPLILPYWYRYEISVVDGGGNLQSHDPRIYNKGDHVDGGGGIEPPTR